MNEHDNDDMPATERLAPVRRSPSPALSQEQRDERMRALAARVAPVLRGAFPKPKPRPKKPRPTE